MLLLLNQTNKESSAGVNITNMQQGVWYNANNQSVHNVSNVDTGDSVSTIAAKDDQIPFKLLNKINNKSSAGENKINNESSVGKNIANNQQGGGG